MLVTDTAIAQSRSYSYTLGPKVGVMYILGPEIIDSARTAEKHT